MAQPVSIAHGGKFVADDNGLPVLVVGSLASIPVTAEGTDVIVSDYKVNTALSLVLPAVAGKRLYVTGFEVTGGGATAASLQAVTLSGIYASALRYSLAVPANPMTGVDPLIVEFTRPLPASADNQSITLYIPAFGAGNVYVGAVLHGFYK